MTGNPVGREKEQVAVIGGEIMIVRAEIVIDIMIGIADMIVIVDMIVNVTGIWIVPAVMIQEVAVGHAQGQGSVPGIMIATGTCSILSHGVPAFIFAYLENVLKIII